ncbi:Type 1 glutamine amidotransferase-like domain-containing protein [Candidatus Woesearchaeota archaeon]|nr:Type 1 glutamine amidotransferase-like domain-containing protein [Candidatus Woesearchaeota archaeon]
MTAGERVKIIAVGGGEIGRPGTNIETESIDREIVKFSGKKHPKLLFIPTASGDSDLYCDVVSNYFGKKLGCHTEVLYLIRKSPSRRDIEEKVFGSDIIYVGGGNTLRMLKTWRRYGLDNILKDAMKRGVVLSGVSAGAICWFQYGNSDSMKFSDRRNPLIKLRGLDIVHGLMACPHYDVERDRRSSLRKMMNAHGGVAIALENCSAFMVKGDNYKILTSSNGACVYKVYKIKGKVVEEPIHIDRKFRPLKELLLRK